MSVNTVMKKMKGFEPWQRAWMRRCLRKETASGVDLRAACRVAISAVGRELTRRKTRTTVWVVDSTAGKPPSAW